MSTHLDMAGGAEFDAIRLMLDAWGARASGIGDDASVLDVSAGERLIASTDATVENVHFRRGWLTASEIGARATNAALSDLAAMAARPIGLLLALGLPDSWRGELDAIAHGVGEAAAAAGCPIVGGNMSASESLSLTITVLGSAVAPLARSGAKPGDIIFVTGLLGGPGAALRALMTMSEPLAYHHSRFASPVPRLREARWLASAGATAAIDISDGLAPDAAHLALASHVSVQLDSAAIPCVPGVTAEQAFASGEEYELLVCVPANVHMDVELFEREHRVPLSRIGQVVARGAEPVLIDGQAFVSQLGHDHLRSEVRR